MLGQGTQTSPSEHHEGPCAHLAFVKVQTHDWMLALWWLALPCLAGQTLGSLVLPQVVRPEHVPGAPARKWCPVLTKAQSTRTATWEKGRSTTPKSTVT